MRGSSDTNLPPRPSAEAWRSKVFGRESSPEVIPSSEEDESQQEQSPMTQVDDLPIPDAYAMGSSVMGTPHVERLFIGGSQPSGASGQVSDCPMDEGTDQ
jgi:hypothetical protein